MDRENPSDDRARAVPTRGDSRIGEAEPSRTCPNCGAPLLERKCKLICPNAECGYFMSCSDFY
jgi:uncharacterized Zn finger protein (UPF0148 family)